MGLTYVRTNDETSIRKSWAKSRSIQIVVSSGTTVVFAALVLGGLLLPRSESNFWIGQRVFWITAGVNVISGFWQWRILRRIEQINKRREAGLCVACGYDLQASKDRCPECGSTIRESAKSIVGRIESLGYSVEYRDNWFGWPHVAAVPLGDAKPHSVKYRGEAELYPAICKLAKLLGIEVDEAYRQDQ
jgi:hypothetical protein